MIHLPAIIEDLCLILVSAALVSLIFKKLKQPVVLGYLIAGVLVGQHVPFFPTVKDPDNINIWGEIGVIFLLFSLGLEFSFKKLAAVGRPASVTAVLEVIFMLGVGFLIGQILGWSKIDSLFLGGILSISSTTIIVRAFQELGFKGRRFVSLVFGILIVEDLIAILLLVLLSTLAVTQSLSGVDLFLTVIKLGFFLILWFVLGIYWLPIFLSKVKEFLDEEAILIVSIGLCLFMVAIATNVGFSPALGAFVMGSIFAETKEGHRIEHILVPVKNLFAAVFFVSVGMLINPQVLVDKFGIILLVTIATILGKLTSSVLGCLISGKDLKQSVQAGMSLAQIGEFSFIIATLGLSLKVTSDFLYPIAVAVSALTTFTTPYQIKYSEKFYHWLAPRIPSIIVSQMQKYEAVMSTKSEKSYLSLLWEQYGIKIILNCVIVGALSLGLSRYGWPWLNTQFPEQIWLPFFLCLANLIFSAPFLWAIVVGAPSAVASIEVKNKISLAQLQFGISIIRTFLGFMIVSLIVSQYLDIQSFAAIFFVFLSLFGVFISRYSAPLYRAIEKRFLSHLNENAASPSTGSELAPWDAILSEVNVSANASCVGQTLAQSRLKEKFGVIVTMIERGQQKILAPGRDDVIYPHDKLYLLGTDDQILAVSQFLEESSVELNTNSGVSDSLDSFGLESIILNSKSRYLNQTIRECGIRTDLHCVIVGIERDNHRILNPDSDLKLKEGDLLWLVGHRQKIRGMRE